MRRRSVAAALAFSLPFGVLGANPMLTKTTWREFDAFKLTDGRAEAVVVPKLGGGVVAFGLIGGTHFIWTRRARRGDEAGHADVGW
jgi:hypothetical protein